MNKKISSILLAFLIAAAALTACGKPDKQAVKVTVPAVQASSTSETTVEETTGSSSPETPSERKYVRFDEMNFSMNGKTYTLGKTTLKELVADGVLAKEKLDKAEIPSNAITIPIKMKIDPKWSVEITAFNPSDKKAKKIDCVINSISWKDKEEIEQKTLKFEFPFDITPETWEETEGRPADGNYIHVEEGKYTADIYRYSESSETYAFNRMYEIEFRNGKLNKVKMQFIP